MAGFIQFGGEGTEAGDDGNDHLVGDTEGLKFLRDQIDHVLNGNDEVKIDPTEVDTNIRGIRRSQRKWYSAKIPINDHRFGCTFGASSLLLLAMALAIMLR